MLLRFILFMLFFGAIGSYCHGQKSVKVLANGDYLEVKDSSGLITGRRLEITFTDLKGCIYPVYETGKGKRYYIKVSKLGREYRAYIKAEGKKDE